MASCGLLWTPADSCGLLRTPADSCRLLRTPVDSCGLLGTPGLPSRFFAFLRIYFGFLLDSLTFWSSFKILCLPRNFSFGFLLDFVWPPADSCGLLRTPADSCGLLRTPADSCGLLWTPADSWGLLAFLRDSLPSSEFILASFWIL